MNDLSTAPASGFFFGGDPLLASLAERLAGWASVPLVWAVLLGAVSLMLLLPRSGRTGRRVGIALGAAAFGALIASGEAFGSLTGRTTFWILAALTLGSATAAISSRSAVYAAVWFAVSLLGTAGLFMFQNAQFLGVATVVVYAGAIVVTFLFVVMLAQPQGHDTYDRLSWGPYAKLVIVITAAIFLGGVLSVCHELRTSPPPVAAPSGQNPDSAAHMAALGNQLFGRHLVSVEVVGTLLLAALVGAVAIVIHGRETVVGRVVASVDANAVDASRREGVSP